MRARPSSAIVLSVFCAAVAVRLIYFATTRSPAFADPLIDGDYYDYLGLRLARGEGFEPGPFWQPPLYPLLLSALYGAFGHDLLWPRLLQAGLEGGTAVLITLLAAQLTASRSFAIAAGVAYALHGPMVFYAGEILPVSAAAFCTTLALYFACAEPRGVARSVASGASAGAGALLVPTVLPVIAPIAWLLWKQQKRSGLYALAACCALVACATLANWTRARELVLISANGGINLYIGNAEDSDRLVAVRPGAGWEELASRPLLAGIESASGQDAYFVRRAVGSCASAPIDCGLHMLEKVRQLAASREIPRNEQIELIARDAPVLRALTPRLGSAVWPSVILFPLAAVGIAAALRRGRHDDRIVVLAVAALGAMVVLFFVTGRYRAQLVPGLIVLAALGAQALTQAVSARSLGAHRGAAPAAAVALVLAVLPLRLPIDDVPLEAEMHYVVGGRRARLGDDRGAIAAWRKAVQIRPDYLEAGFNLGLAYERLGLAELAASAYRAVLSSHPGQALALERLSALQIAR